MPNIHACCDVPENLYVAEMRADQTVFVRKCKVCGCKHIEVTLEPGDLTALSPETEQAPG